MNQWKRIVTISLVVLMVITLIILRQNEKTKDVDQTTDIEDETIEIRIMTMFGGIDPAKSTFEEQLAEFEALYPKVKIINDSMTSVGNEYRIAVKTAFTTGNEPDMMFFFTGADADGIIKSGNVVSREELLDSYPMLGSHIRESSYESVREKDGHIYAVPITGFYEGLFVNRQIFEQYGIELPTDWQKFLNAIERLEAEGIVPLAAPIEQSYYIVENFILGDSSIDEYTDLLDDEIPPGWIKGLNRIRDLYQMGMFTNESFAMNAEMAQEQFLEGEAAMIIEGSWFAGRCNGCNDTVTVMPLPTPPNSSKEPGTIIGGYSSGYYISRSAFESDKQAIVMDLLNFLISAKSIEEMALANGGIPSSDIDVMDVEPVVMDGYQMVKDANQLVMPIDSRLITEAFSYIVSEGLPYLLYEKMTAEEILIEVRRIQRR